MVILIFMKALLALITIMIWPVIPLMWVPVHFATGFFRRLGRLTYMFVAVPWFSAAYLIFLHREVILSHQLDISPVLKVAGLLLLAAGTMLHMWTAALLTFPGIVGIHEISEPQKSSLVDKGPFAAVRHPTYLAHTMMFLGVFLFTGFPATGILTLVDFIVVGSLVIPLEERELLQRFGMPYRDYMKRVPRLVPRLPRKH
jgi:protein-S-isoprenylcysteine O-methyltransferase Ste14